ncbi:MAG: DUF4286 family protein [Bacteroidales bacterium]|nr:DUF4286 family protein [Bacteroidales bacterium]
MTQICNITFVCSEADAAVALEYLRAEIIPALTHENAEGLRLTRVRNAAGEAVSYALEVHFPDLHSVRAWRSDCMRPALNRMSEQWGERLMYFDTMLEVLPLR